MRGHGQTNPTWFVAGREPYRGKWRIQPDVMSKAAADEYAGELRDMGWRDVITADLTALRLDLITLASGTLHTARRTS